VLGRKGEKVTYSPNELPLSGFDITSNFSPLSFAEEKTGFQISKIFDNRKESLWVPMETKIIIKCAYEIDLQFTHHGSLFKR
jgi:hypothetical protein